jgi:hypothetical protein
MNVRPSVKSDPVEKRRITSSAVWCFAILCLLAIVILLAVFPAWTGTLWHIFHGNATTYAGWIVPVPRGFFSFHSRGCLLIERMEPRLAGFGRRADMVVMCSVPSDKYFVLSRDFPTFERIESGSAAQNGLTERLTKTIQKGPSGRTCIEFDRPAGSETMMQHPELQISCFIEGEPTTLSYSGTARYSSDVYSIVANMSKALPAKGE